MSVMVEDSCRQGAGGKVAAWPSRHHTTKTHYPRMERATQAMSTLPATACILCINLQERRLLLRLLLFFCSSTTGLVHPSRSQRVMAGGLEMDDTITQQASNDRLPTEQLHHVLQCHAIHRLRSLRKGKIRNILRMLR